MFINVKSNKQDAYLYFFIEYNKEIMNQESTKKKKPSGVRSLECKFLRGNKFIPQSHQQRAVEIYKKLEKGQRGILLYHKFGSGKTCTSILIADNLLKDSANNLNHVWVLTPGNLRRNFRHEYCFICGKYVSELQKNYTFISYNYGRLKVDEKLNFDNSVIIIDEIHNLIKAFINAEKNEKSVAKALIIKLFEANNIKIIALSGDPIYSCPIEAKVLFKLLKPSLGSLDIDELLKTPDEFKHLIRNLISYVSGKTEDFPQIVEHIVECKMSESQREKFIPIKENEDKFRRNTFRYPLDDSNNKTWNNSVMIAKLYIRSRMISNFCYPREARLIEWIKEDEDKNDIINIDEIKAELCEDAEGKKEEETPPLIYIVVASELKMFETSYDDSKELDPLKQGDRLTG